MSIKKCSRDYLVYVPFFFYYFWVFIFGSFIFPKFLTSVWLQCPFILLTSFNFFFNNCLCLFILICLLEDNVFDKFTKYRNITPPILCHSLSSSFLNPSHGRTLSGFCPSRSRRWCSYWYIIVEKAVWRVILLLSTTTLFERVRYT